MHPEPFEECLRTYLDGRTSATGTSAAVERTLRGVFDRAPRAHARRLLMAVVIAVVAALVVATPVTVFLVNRSSQSAPTQVAHASPAPLQRATVPLDGSPGAPAVNPKTGTLYVPIECPTWECTSASTVVDVINSASCNAVNASDCQVVAQALVGSGPAAVAIDQATDTIYVRDENGTTAVIDGARCNARVTSGCDAPVATISVGGIAAVIDPATRTLYVADPGGGVHVIDITTCDAARTTGCRQAGRLVTDDTSPVAIDIDIATDTVYAVNTEWGSGFSDANDADLGAGGDSTTQASGASTVSVIDGATCNGSD